MIVPDKQSISDINSYMILELHRNTLLPTPIPLRGLNMNEYYAADYVNCYYSTLAGFLTFKVNLSNSRFCIVFGMVQTQAIPFIGQ